jgi:hypothetical protein
MKKARKTYTVFQLSSAVLMLIALLWLTVSTPFVYAAQQELAKHTKVIHSDESPCDEEETSNSIGNTTEEKKPSGNNSLSEEYLHHHQYEENFFTIVSQTHMCENADIYVAYHGELDVPPPDLA